MKTFYALVFGLAVLLCGCSRQDGQEVKIGLIAELTGDMPVVGASSRDAAQLAVDEVNAEGGLEVKGKRYRVKLLTEDYRAQPQQAAAATQKLISQGQVLAIVGPNASLGAVPASEIAESARTVLISPWSTNPKTTVDARTGQPKRYVFRACFTDPFQGKVLAGFVKNRLKIDRAAVLYDGGSEAPNGQALLFSEEFLRRGGKVVASERYSTGDRDFRAQLTKIKAADPQVVYLPAYYNDVPLVVQQARQVGLDVPFLGSDAWSNPTLIELSGYAVEGFYLTNHYSPESTAPAAQRFISEYKRRYVTYPDAVAALTYDAFQVLFAGIRKAGSTKDREALRSALNQLQPVAGVTGSIQYTGTGDPVKSVVILRIQGGNFGYVTEAEP